MKMKYSKAFIGVIVTWLFCGCSSKEDIVYAEQSVHELYTKAKYFRKRKL